MCFFCKLTEDEVEEWTAFSLIIYFSIFTFLNWRIVFYYVFLNKLTTWLCTDSHVVIPKE